VGLHVLALLIATGPNWRPAPDPSQPPGGRLHLMGKDGWKVADLLRYLESCDLDLYAAPTGSGEFNGWNAYLFRDEKSSENLTALPADPRQLYRWEGVVYCEYVPHPEGMEVRLRCWGDACLRAGPFLFFGDPALLAKIRQALSTDPKGTI
jgi:hypothetical protein